MPASPRESLASMLTVERLREGEFLAQLEDFWGESLRGDLLARAALAAAETCEGKQLHSLHTLYLRPAAASVPLTVIVDRLDDSPRLAHRSVRVVDAKLLCQVAASFVAPEDGVAYQDVKLEPGLPKPEDLPSTLETARAEGWADYARGPVEFRRVGPLWPDAAAGEPCIQVEWVRPREPLPDDPRAHMAAAVFLSDFYSHWPFERRLGKTFAHDRFRPLDHAVWLHRAVRWDDWWLMRAVSKVGHAGRALARRELFTRDGILVASAAQEGLVATT